MELETGFSTTIDQDEEILENWDDSDEGNTYRLKSAILYRLNRKHLILKQLDFLSIFISILEVFNDSSLDLVQAKVRKFDN